MAELKGVCIGGPLHGQIKDLGYGMRNEALFDYMDGKGKTWTYVFRFVSIEDVDEDYIEGKSYWFCEPSQFMIEFIHHYLVSVYNKS